MKNVSLVFAMIMVMIFTGTALAAPTPDLYPNQYLKKVGPERARHEINDCQIAANDYISQTGSQTTGAQKAVKGAARGAALGALGATIMNQKAGRGAGAGAAIGGIKAVSDNRKEQSQGSPEYRKYVEACLSDRGYTVVGWR